MLITLKVSEDSDHSLYSLSRFLWPKISNCAVHSWFSVATLEKSFYSLMDLNLRITKMENLTYVIKIWRSTWTSMPTSSISGKIYKYGEYPNNIPDILRLYSQFLHWNECSLIHLTFVHFHDNSWIWRFWTSSQAKPFNRQDTKAILLRNGGLKFIITIRTPMSSTYLMA